MQCYTTLGAYAGKEEHLKGDLSIGKLADFAVLEEDVFTIEPESLAGVRVVETWVDGEKIFARG